MSITTIGSSFTYIAPVMAVAQTAPTARVVEAAAASASGDKDERTDDGTQSFPARLASTVEREVAARPSHGLLIQAQQAAPAPTSRSEVARVYHAT
ncbi:hypothetical protein EYW49_18270 [Siculibacillus lacustris]|uniref:Uncharacterized protein n=1 Tax=Siculibacillus lacustris TaxID=1549641 RepID=A0A4Q9VHM4_9HYPH|nr:hypothetical protein [Siculibacillus lacustris]TBW34385.1 hypothetical protein EYW49_18270 [Siculibacillus lacustris]